MDLLRRYLQAVEFWLPGKQKQDILAELSEDIRSEIEDKEAELGRPVGPIELQAILTRWGHPMLVAERYLPQRSLIGPVLLPAYKFVLTMVTLVYLVPWLLVGLGFVIFDPARRTADAIGDGLQAFWLVALHLVVLVTAIFALLERRRAGSRSWETWNAASLLEHEPARDPNAIPRSQSIGELVVDLLTLWLWLNLMGRPAIHHLADTFRFTVAPLYPGLYWTIVVFLLAGVVLAFANLRRPWWTRRRAGAQLAIDSLGLVVCLVTVLGGPLVVITAASPAPEMFNLAKWANFSWYFTIAIIALYFAARIIQHARRIAGKKPLRIWTMTALGAG